MSGVITTQSIMDDILRGIAIAGVNRLVWTRQPVFSQGTLNDGFRFGMASVTYALVSPVIKGILPPQLSGILPNGN